MTEPETLEIEDMRLQFGTLEIGPNDYLVFQYDGHLSQDAMDRMREFMKERMPEIGDRVLVLENGLKIGKMTVEN